MAASLAAKIESVLGISPTLIQGSGGIFDIVADGNLIFSKYETGRFPEFTEVIDLLRSR
ncbi:MAG: Rdx family protein [Nitrososphaera sp.]|nr:Rdx family protein [Nitrososphaera sp.]